MPLGAGHLDTLRQLLPVELLAASVAFDHYDRVGHQSLVGGEPLAACGAFAPATDAVAGLTAVYDVSVFSFTEWTDQLKRSLSIKSLNQGFGSCGPQLVVVSVNLPLDIGRVNGFRTNF